MKLNATIFLLTTILVAACGGGDSGPVSVLEGRVIKGVVSNATVSAYLLDDKAEKTQLIAQGTTTEDGHYRIEFGGDQLRPVLVEVTSNENTTMTCELVEGCKSKVSGETVQFGEKFKIADDLKLSAILPLVYTDRVTPTNINLFTTLANRTVVKSATEKPVDSISVANANSKISDLLQQLNVITAEESITSVTAIDFTNKDEILKSLKDSNASTLRLTSLSSAFAKIATDEYEGDYEAAFEAFTSEYQKNKHEFVRNKSDETTFTILNLLQIAQSEIERVEHQYDHKILFTAVKQNLDDEINKIAKPKVVVVKETERVEILVPTPATPEPPADVKENITTETSPFYAIEKYLFNDNLNAKDLVAAFRTLGYTFEENARKITNDVALSMGGRIDMDKVAGDITSVASTANKSIPYAGEIMVAMVRMVENDYGPSTYDIGADPDHFFPDDIQFIGVVRKTDRWGTKVLKLENGFVEGVGKIDLEMSFYGCYFCYSNYATVNLRVQGDLAAISLSSFVVIYRDYSYQYGVRIPTELSFSNANVTLELGKSESVDKVSMRGSMDIRIRKPYWSSALPTVNSFNLRGSFYKTKSEDLSYFSANISYYNSDGYSYATDPVQWAKSHSRNFQLSAAFDARVKVPSPNQLDQPQEQLVGVTLGLTNSYWSGESRSIGIRYKGEQYTFARTSGNSNQYTFSNKAGAIMQLLIDPNAKSLLAGEIRVNGKQVASIQSGQFGPVIRYTDGSIESF